MAEKGVEEQVLAMERLLYYKDINSKDGNYYRRWASVFGPSMSELIERVLKASKHEEKLEEMQPILILQLRRRHTWFLILSGVTTIFRLTIRSRILSETM